MANYVSTYENFKENPFIIKQYVGKPRTSWFGVGSDELIKYNLNTTKSRSKLTIEYVEDLWVTGGEAGAYQIITMWWRYKK